MCLPQSLVWCWIHQIKESIKIGSKVIISISPTGQGPQGGIFPTLKWQDYCDENHYHVFSLKSSLEHI